MHAFLPVVLAAASAALFGAATPASKRLLDTLGAFQLAGLLYVGAALFAALAARRGTRPALDRVNRRRLAGAVLLGGAIGPVLLLAALQLAAAASVSLWLNLELAATAALGHLVFHDHLGRFGWCGVTGIVAAGMLLSAGAGAAGAVAGLLVAAACTCWAIDNHLTALIDGLTPAESTFWKGFVAGSVNLVVGLTLERPAAGPGVLVTALGVGALSYGASIVLYITAAQTLGATRAQMIFASAPFWGVALSLSLLGEPFSLIQVAAAALLIGSLLLLFGDRHGHEHVHAATAHTHLHRHDDGHHTHVHPGQPASLLHAHWHEHEPLVHAHPHWPDLHHRHPHGDRVDRERFSRQRSP